jgi:hypothetical protein
LATAVIWIFGRPKVLAVRGFEVEPGAQSVHA